MIRIGPAGIGGVKEAVSNLEKYHKLGIKACEIPFTYGVYIKETQKELIKKIKQAAEKFGIKLSIHAQYWINLNSKEKQKIEDSKRRILECCKVGEMLGVKIVVFHPGFYNGFEPEETYQNIKKEILEIQKEIKKNKWHIKIAPETTGKVNVFGKEEEILRLIRDTGCSFCIDFSHLLARSQGKMTYKEMYDKVRNFSKLHCHFSGIEWGEKGEKRHIPTPESEIKKFISVFPKDKNITIISEAPDPFKDALRLLSALGKRS